MDRLSYTWNGIWRYTEYRFLGTTKCQNRLSWNRKGSLVCFCVLSCLWLILNLLETNVRVLVVESLENHIITLQTRWKLTSQELEVYLSVLPALAEAIVNLVSLILVSAMQIQRSERCRKPDSQWDIRKICFLRSKLQDKAEGEATSCLLVYMPYTMVVQMFQYSLSCIRCR